MRKLFLNWPFLSLAFLLAGMLSLPSAGGALLDSRLSNKDGSSPSPEEIEKELVTAYLKEMGWDSVRIAERMSHLSPAEVHKLAFSLPGVIAGAGEQGKKAAGVALAIIIAVGLITGFYLFYNAD